jgi:hypothetical protein
MNKPLIVLANCCCRIFGLIGKTGWLHGQRRIVPDLEFKD